ncbi:MAG: RNA polymerase sigma factor [Cellvibrionaceae bacterium]
MNDDIELLNGIKNKDMASMEAFYRLYENIVYRFSMKKLNNEFDASDIVNTVMLEVWNTAHRFEGRSKISTWLIGIANHRIIDLLRKKKKGEVDIDEASGISDDSVDMQKVVEASQTRRFIDFCLEKLSGDHKQVLQLLFFNEASYEEISDALECPIGTIKSRLYHAKTLLKKCLEKRAEFS